VKYVPKELVETADVSRGRQSLLRTLKGAIAIFVVLFVAYLGLGLVVDVVVYNISEQAEAEWFDGILPLVFEPDAVPAALLERFETTQTLFDELVERGELRPLPYRLHFLDMEAPNAFAVPGGSVGVTRGLLENVESDRGLAMVLAHELGHHEYRHCLERMGRSLSYRVALSFFFGSEPTEILRRTLNVAEASYSREHEREADRFGLALLDRIYGDTEGALAFYEYVQRAVENEPHLWQKLLASHPVSQERLDYLRELQQQFKEKR